MTFRIKEKQAVQDPTDVDDDQEAEEEEPPEDGDALENISENNDECKDAEGEDDLSPLN